MSRVQEPAACAPPGGIGGPRLHRGPGPAGGAAGSAPRTERSCPASAGGPSSASTRGREGRSPRAARARAPRPHERPREEAEDGRARRPPGTRERSHVDPRGRPPRDDERPHKRERVHERPRRPAVRVREPGSRVAGVFDPDHRSRPSLAPAVLRPGAGPREHVRDRRLLHGVDEPSAVRHEPLAPRLHRPDGRAAPRGQQECIRVPRDPRRPPSGESGRSRNGRLPGVHRHGREDGHGVPRRRRGRRDARRDHGGPRVDRGRERVHVPKDRRGLERLDSNSTRVCGGGPWHGREPSGVLYPGRTQGQHLAACRVREPHVRRPGGHERFRPEPEHRDPHRRAAEHRPRDRQRVRRVPSASPSHVAGPCEPDLLHGHRDGHVPDLGSGHRQPPRLVPGDRRNGGRISERVQLHLQPEVHNLRSADDLAGLRPDQ